MKYDFELIIEEDNSLSKIVRQIQKESVVLEFGPATGRMTKFLKEYLCCKVYIVEIDDVSAQKASQYAEDTIIGDISDYRWLSKWGEIKFDYIIFADVLEHLRDPQEVLSKTKILLKDDGKTIFSVPNVAHNSILINLFNNIFNYTPVGLLDNTHIHLFAYNTLKEFCNYAGYVPVIEDAIYANVGENEVAATYDQVNSCVQKELKKRIYSNVYQFVFTLQKKSYVKMNQVEIVKRIIPYTNDYKFVAYFDKGQDWMEESSISFFFRPMKKNRFIVPIFDNELIKEIRIDPIDCSCGLKIEQIVLYKEDSYEILNLNNHDIVSNAEFQRKDEYLFTTNDPNIYLKNVDWVGVHKMEIDIEWIDSQQLSIDFLKDNKREDLEDLDTIRKLNEAKADLENKNKLINEELERRAIELDHRQDVINKLNDDKSELENKYKQANEELERRAIELDHRQSVINKLNDDKSELENKYKQANEELKNCIFAFPKHKRK